MYVASVYLATHTKIYNIENYTPHDNHYTLWLGKNKFILVPTACTIIEPLNETN